MPVAARARLSSALKTTLESGTAKPVGDHAPPADTSERYAIVWTIPGGGFEGSMASAHEMATFVYQVDASGRSREQAELHADKVRQVVLEDTITVTGLKVIQRWVDVPGGVEAEGRDETGKELFTSRERYALQVAPA